jgi:hypothetical protein
MSAIGDKGTPGRPFFDKAVGPSSSGGRGSQVKVPQPHQMLPGQSDGTLPELPMVTDEHGVTKPHPRPWTLLPRNRKTKLAVMGVPTHLLDKGDPEYARCLRLANKYRKQRIRELSQMHGGVSSGASALLSSASLALAASRFLYAKAAEGGDLGVLRQASGLADSARNAEIAAWELAAREGVVRKRMEAAAAGSPWMLQASDDKRGRGRPSKQTTHADTVVQSGTVATDTPSLPSPLPSSEWEVE